MESFFSFSHQKRWIKFFSLFLLVCVLAQKGSCEFDSFESYNDAYVFSPQSIEMMGNESELVMPNSMPRTEQRREKKVKPAPVPQPPTVTPQLPSLPVARPPEQQLLPAEKTAKRASSNQKVLPQKRDTVESASLYSSLSNSSLESEMNSRRLSSSFYEPYSSRSVPVSSLSVPSSRSISSSPYSSPYAVTPQSLSDRSSSSSYSEMSPSSSSYSVMSQSTNESRTPQFMDENFAEPRYLQGYYGYGYGYGYPYYRGYYRYPYGYGGYYRHYRPYGYYRRLDGTQVQGMVPAEMDEFPYQRDQPFQQFYPNAYPRNEFDRRMKEISQKNKVESASVNDSRMRKLGFGMGLGQVGLDIGEMSAMSQMGENLMRGNAGGALGDFAMMEGMNAMSGGGGMGGMGALGAMEMGAMAMNLRRLKQNESKEPMPMRRMRTRQVENPYSESQNEQSNPMNVVNPYETEQANPMETVRPLSMQEVCASSPELCSQRRNEVSDYRRNEMEEHEERERQAERRMKMFPSYTSELESEE